MAVLPCLAILIALGLWQVERMSWKADLIAEMEERMHGPAVALPDRLDEAVSLRFQRVMLSGHFRNEAEIYREAQTYRNQVGLFVITPFVLEDGREILVNRGWVPSERRDPSSRSDGQVSGEVEIEAIVRIGGWQGMDWIRPENAPEKNVWVWMDLESMAGHAGMSNTITSIYVDLAEGQNPAPLPVDGQTHVNLSENHLGYAITWFGIAAGLVVIYIVFHLRLERTTLREEKGAKQA